MLGLVAGLVLFSWLHGLAGTDPAPATTNSHALMSTERLLHLDVEEAGNDWLVEHRLLIPAAVAYYRLYYLPLAGVLVWVFLRHPEVYRTLVRVLVVMAALALLVFWLLPVSPPRLAQPGIVDVVAEHDLFGNTGSRNLGNGQNHFSAMPSLHVGWSAVCAWAAWSAGRGSRPRLALLAWLFPLGMVAVVITTGNHYLLDVAGSALLVAVSIGAARGWERQRSRRARGS